VPHPFCRSERGIQRSSSRREETKIAQGETLGEAFDQGIPAPEGRCESPAPSLDSAIRGASVRSAPPGRMSSVCLLPRAALALGYFRWLPTGADRCAAHGMANVEVHLELLAFLPVERLFVAICIRPRSHQSSRVRNASPSAGCSVLAMYSAVSRLSPWGRMRTQ